MKRPPLIDALVALGLAVATLSHAAEARFAWPHGEQAAVSPACDDATASQLDNAIPALDRHGIGGDYITTSTKAHEELPACLAAHRDVYWTATFIDIMTYVKAHQAPGARP